MALPRKLRRELNDRVCELEELDLTGNTLEDFQEILRRVNNFLDGNGILPESDYRKRVKMVEERAKDFYEPKKDKPKDEPPKEDDIDKRTPDIVYLGFVKSILYEVIPYDRRLVVRDCGYDGTRPDRLTWCFNLDGRLKFLGLKSWKEGNLENY